MASWAICVCLSYDPQQSNKNVPISKLVGTMRFWNNLHQVRSKLKDRKANNLKVWEQ